MNGNGELKGAAKFLAENYLVHKIEPGPDDDASQLVYLRKDGSYTPVSHVEFAEMYAEAIRQQNARNLREADERRVLIERRLAEAVKAVETATQTNAASKAKVAALRKTIASLGEQLKKVAEE